MAKDKFVPKWKIGEEYFYLDILRHTCSEIDDGRYVIFFDILDEDTEVGYRCVILDVFKPHFNKDNPRIRVIEIYKRMLDG
jgi:hypothetical protein